MPRPVLPVAGLTVLLAAASAAQPHPATGRWEGALTFRGAEMPLRLVVAAEGDSLAVALDFPALLMVGEPAPAVADARGLDVTFPFGLGPLRVEPVDDAVLASTPLGGDTLSLRLRRDGPPPYVEVPVAFESGGAALAGTLVLPEGPGPHPGVVLVHGSGRLGRHSQKYRPWADFLARQGLAVLYYDKRGVGESGGTYGAPLPVLAADAAAALRALRARPEVDPARVGLKGTSQGAWLAEQVAADLSDVAFLLLVSAAAGTPRDQEMQSVEYGMRADGRSEAEIEDALAYLGLYFYVARTGAGWSALEAAAARAQGEDWGGYVDQPRTPDDLAWWRASHDLQPARLVEGLELPALLLYGGADWITPPVENADKLRGLFPTPDRVEAHVFPRADHWLEVPAWTDDAGRWHWPQIAPGALEAVADWLRRAVPPRAEP